MPGSFVLILHTHLPYVIRHGKWPFGSDWLCEAAAECYLPLLNEFNALLDDGIVPAVTMSFTPVVLEQLADDEFPQIFNDYLDEKIIAAGEDVEYFSARPHERHYAAVAQFWRQWYQARRDEFNGRYRCDIVGAYRSLVDAGAIVAQTAGATHGYFPLLGFDESIDGQLSIAVSAHRRHFGDAPRGAWIPECAYRPCYLWSPPVDGSVAPIGVRKGVEQLLAEHGLEYTVVDSHLTRGGRPLGVYADRFESVRTLGARSLPLQDSRSVHELYRVCSTGDPDAGMASIFTRDTETTMRVWSGHYGYPGDATYLDFHKKHHNSGLRYWRVTGPDVDMGDKELYDPDAVAGRIDAHADHFCSLVERELREFEAATGRHGTLAAPFDTELFGHWWFEGPAFIAALLRRMAVSDSVDAVTAPDDLDASGPGAIIQIPEGSWGDGGDHRVWLNDRTWWTWPEIHRAEQRFFQLLFSADTADRLEQRVLRQMAREKLLLEASDWQFLITTDSAVDYAVQRFGEHRNQFWHLVAFVEHLRSGGELDAEQMQELEALEAMNRLFPDLRLDAWRDSKSRLGAQVASGWTPEEERLS